MPSSMIFSCLVVIWLFVLVPAVARHRQEVARPSVAALSGRVLERPRQRRADAGRGPEMGRDPVPGRELEVDVMVDADEPRAVATRAGTTRAGTDRSGRDREVRVPEARAPEVSDAGADVGRWRDDDRADRPSDPADGWDADGWDTAGWDTDGRDAAGWETDGGGDGDDGWDRPPHRYRPGRGGFDPEAAALAARARYGFRQRVVLAMLIAAVVTGVVAAMAVPDLWLPHAVIDLALVGYLVYLRQQVRMEESIRDRRAARMAGTSRPHGVEDQEPAGRTPRTARPETDHGPATPDDGPVAEPDRNATDDLTRERPERVTGTGALVQVAPASMRGLPEPLDGPPALPRLQPAPPPPLPAGTTLVEADEDDPELHDLDGPVRPDYRRAAGE